MLEETPVQGFPAQAATQDCEFHDALRRKKNRLPRPHYSAIGAASAREFHAGEPGDTVKLIISMIFSIVSIP
jgi:hypothetical protein